MMTTPHPSSARLSRLQNFLREDPDNEALQADLFDLALAEGAFDIAAHAAASALAAAPGNPQWRHRLALLHIAREDYEGAERLLAELEASDPGHGVIAYNRGLVAYRRGRYEDGLAFLMPLIERADAPVDSFAQALRCLHASRRPDLAAQTYAERAQGGRHDPAAAGVASLAAVDANRMADALAWSALALRTHPDQMEALVAAGTAALGRQDATTATGFLQHALDVHPGDGRALSALGMAHMLRLELAQALRCFELAVQRMPNHIGTWHGMAWSQMMLKDIDGAQRSFECALELDRNFGESHGGLAVVLAMQGRTNEAEAAIERALRLDPRNVSARYAQAVLNGEARDVERFRRLAERVLSQHSTAEGTPLVDLVLRRRV